MARHLLFGREQFVPACFLQPPGPRWPWERWYNGPVRLFLLPTRSSFFFREALRSNPGDSVKTLLALVVASILGGALAGEERRNAMPAEAQAILEKASPYELLSLEPSGSDDDEDKKVEKFHGWRVLGKTAIKEADARKMVLTALVKGMAENDGSAAKCFNPRHGLRAVHDKKTVDLVICFECLQVEVYVDGKQVHPAGARGPFLTSESPQPTLDKLLKDAKVPLARKPE